MEAFEKWWEVSGVKKRGGWGFKWLAKLAWRAALEWALNEWHADQWEFESVVRKELRETE